MHMLLRDVKKFYETNLLSGVETTIDDNERNLICREIILLQPYDQVDKSRNAKS